MNRNLIFATMLLLIAAFMPGFASAEHSNNWGGGSRARPKYDPPETHYVQGPKHDLQIYIEFMRNQITELLTN